MKLPTVRLRASRRYQLLKEMREMLVLVALAVVGLVALTDSGAFRVTSLVALGVLVTIVVVARLRSTLTRNVSSRT